jgi:hypothetical protein
MDYEREKGRINGHRTARRKAIEFAKIMVPILAIAREEVSDRDGEGHSKLGLAKWLNANNYKTINKKTWRSESVFRLLDSHIGWLEEIDREYENFFQLRKTALEDQNLERQTERLAELGDIEALRESQIIEVQKLKAALRGHKYVEETVHPPLPPMLVRKREARSRRERQLKLFTDLPPK